MVISLHECNRDQKTSGLEVKLSKCETRLQYGQKTAPMQPGSENRWYRRYIIKMWNPVALWSENGTDGTGDQKTSGLEVKKSKCETRLHRGQKTAAMQPGIRRTSGLEVK